MLSKQIAYKLQKTVHLTLYKETDAVCSEIHRKNKPHTEASNF